MSENLLMISCGWEPCDETTHYHRHPEGVSVGLRHVPGRGWWVSHEGIDDVMRKDGSFVRSSSLPFDCFFETWQMAHLALFPEDAGKFGPTGHTGSVGVTGPPGVCGSPGLKDDAPESRGWAKLRPNTWAKRRGNETLELILNPQVTDGFFISKPGQTVVLNKSGEFVDSKVCTEDGRFWSARWQDLDDLAFGQEFEPREADGWKKYRDQFGDKWRNGDVLVQCRKEWRPDVPAGGFYWHAWKFDKAGSSVGLMESGQWSKNSSSDKFSTWFVVKHLLSKLADAVGLFGAVHLGSGQPNQYPLSLGSPSLDGPKPVLVVDTELDPREIAKRICTIAEPEPVHVLDRDLHELIQEDRKRVAERETQRAAERQAAMEAQARLSDPLNLLTEGDRKRLAKIADLQLMIADRETAIVILKEKLKHVRGFE